MEGLSALLFSRIAHGEIRSALPDAPTTEPPLTYAERRAARIRHRAAARAVRSAESVVRSAARSAARRRQGAVAPQAGTHPVDPTVLWW